MATPKERWTREDVIDALQWCADTLILADFGVRESDYASWRENRSVPDLPAVHRLIPGGWSNACKAAGLPDLGGVRPKRKLADARRAMKLARELWGKRDPIRWKDYHQLMSPRPEYVPRRTLIYYWGSWADACLANGLFPGHRRFDLEDDEDPTLTQVRRLLPSTMQQFDTRRPDGSPTAHAWQQRFGNWTAAQLAFGCSIEEIRAVQKTRRTSK